MVRTSQRLALLLATISAIFFTVTFLHSQARRQFQVDSQDQSQSLGQGHIKVKAELDHGGSGSVIKNPSLPVSAEKGKEKSKEKGFEQEWLAGEREWEVEDEVRKDSKIPFSEADVPPVIATWETVKGKEMEKGKGIGKDAAEAVLKPVPFSAPASSLASSPSPSRPASVETKEQTKQPGEHATEKTLPWTLIDAKKNSNQSPLDWHPPRASDEKSYVKGLLDWSRPSWEGHWPAFGEYEGKGYDPNRWEEFEYDNRFYTSTHNRLAPSAARNSKPYNPFPAYDSPAYKAKHKGTYTPCIGPRNLPLNASAADDVHAYASVPASFPKVFAGGYDIVGLDGGVCFDRYARYGAYGLGDDEDPNNVVDWKAPETVPEWDEVDWGFLQESCLERNRGRFGRGKRGEVMRRVGIKAPASFHAVENSRVEEEEEREGDEKIDGKEYHSRTAVLIRTWTGYTYEPNDLIAIRALVSELSLRSGGEYTVYLFVHVKDSSLDIFNNVTLYNDVLRQHVPRELRSMALLWSERIFPSWYPDVADWQVYWQQFMCVQWFSHTHPEFDYIWNWETDARYIGHHYHFLSTISSFATAQPRKLLWERNKRYYLPSIHGSYASFVANTHADVLNASAHSLIPPPVWGPRPYAAALPKQHPTGPTPPHSFAADNFTWGVGEPADFITLLPMWDPRNTSWSYKDKIWNYAPAVRPIFSPEDPNADAFTHPDFDRIDRRVFINTVVRFSRRLLATMHAENTAGRSMQAEMWPSTVALQHGLKAVYAPHPIFSDRHWPEPYAAAIFDSAHTVEKKTGAAVESVQGAWTEQADSVYNHDREANFAGWSWYFASRFPRTLYRRWLGWRVVRQEWGEPERVVGGRGSDGLEQERRMCVPAMLLHPVKRMAEEGLNG